jgi:hypothetical protein
MSKTTPNKYFVGQLDKAKRGSAFRIFRQRKSLLGNIIDEVCLKTGWKRMEAGYKKVGICLNSQAAVRADKRMWEGKGAR